MTVDKNQIYSKFIIIFIFIDLLLLPYFPFFVIPISLPVVVYMVALRKIAIVNNREFVVFLLLGFLVLISVLLSFLNKGSNIHNINAWIENIKRAFQLLTSFLYYFIIKNSSIKSKVNIKNIIIIFVTIYSILGIVSYIDVGLYFRILNLLGVNNPFVSDWYIRQKIELYRFTYIWIDPNNAAYAFQMVVFYMLTNEKLNSIEKIYVYLSLLLSLVLSMSTGALVSAAIFFTLHFIMKAKNTTRIKTTYKKIITGAIVLALSLGIIGSLWILFGEIISSIGNYSFDRMLSNTGAGRLEKYTFMFNDKIPNLIGEGYVLIREGTIFRPHSDHLRLIYSYGLVAYFVTLWLLFRHVFDSTKFIFIIPGFIAFSINSLIGEQKILLILLSLIAYVNYKSKHDIYNHKYSSIKEVNLI